MTSKPGDSEQIAHFEHKLERSIEENFKQLEKLNNEKYKTKPDNSGLLIIGGLLLLAAAG